MKFEILGDLESSEIITNTTDLRLFNQSSMEFYYVASDVPICFIDVKVTAVRI